MNSHYIRFYFAYLSEFDLVNIALVNRKFHASTQLHLECTKPKGSLEDQLLETCRKGQIINFIKVWREMKQKYTQIEYIILRVALLKKCFLASIESGDLRMIQYFVDCGIRAWNEGLEKACELNNRKVIDYITQTTKYPIFHPLLRVCITHNHLDLAEFVIEQSNYPSRVALTGFYEAYKMNNPEMITLLKKYTCRTDRFGSIKGALDGGHYELAKSLFSGALTHYHPQMFFDASCFGGNWDCIHWTLSLFEEFQVNYESALNSACCGGHLDVVQWLCDQISDDANAIYSSITNSVIYNHISIYEYLKNRYSVEIPMNIVAHIEDVEMIKKVEIARPFLEQLVDIHLRNGNLKIVDYLKIEYLKKDTNVEKNV